MHQSPNVYASLRGQVEGFQPHLNFTRSYLSDFLVPPSREDVVIKPGITRKARAVTLRHSFLAELLYKLPDGRNPQGCRFIQHPSYRFSSFFRCLPRGKFPNGAELLSVRLTILPVVLDVPRTAFFAFNNVLRSFQRSVLSFERTDDGCPEITTGFDRSVASKSF